MKLVFIGLLVSKSSIYTSSSSSSSSSLASVLVVSESDELPDVLVSVFGSMANLIFHLLPSVFDLGFHSL